jgi:transposase-like protein
MSEQRRRYTHAQRVAAVAEAEVNGAEQAAEATGIPRTTILYWLDKPEFVELRQKTREEKRDGYRVLIAKAQERLAQLIPSMEPRDLTILLGVAQDKDLLLSGDATSRTEARSLTDGYSDDEKRKLRDWIDSLVDTPTGDAEGDSERAGAEVR